jgi:hypothetical protein
MARAGSSCQIADRSIWVAIHFLRVRLQVDRLSLESWRAAHEFAFHSLQETLGLRQTETQLSGVRIHMKIKLEYL